LENIQYSLPRGENVSAAVLGGKYEKWRNKKGKENAK
jgi:hypothetical protein